MASRDLAHQREAESRAGGVAIPGAAVERLKYPLEFGRSNATAAVPDSQFRVAAHACNAYLCGRCAVAGGIFEQIADQPPQEARVAAYHRRCALQMRRVMTGALLGSQRQEIHFFAGIEPCQGIQPTCQQDFVDQLIQLADILFQSGLALRIRGCLHQFDCHANPRQRRSKIVRSVGQERPVSSHELLDTRCRRIEAAGKLRYFVTAFHGDPRREIARSQGFATRLQALEPLGEPTGYGKGRHADSNGEHDERDQQREWMPGGVGGR